jgi:hypothetical protein
MTTLEHSTEQIPGHDICLDYDPCIIYTMGKLCDVVLNARKSGCTWTPCRDLEMTDLCSTGEKVK